MHVSFVLPMEERYSETSGGAIATVTRHLAKELSKDGVDTTVLSPDDGTVTGTTGIDVRLLNFGPARQPALWRRVLAKAAPMHAAALGVGGPAYRRAVHRALDRVHPDAVVIANDPGLAEEIAMASHGRVLLWLHNLLTTDEAPTLCQLPDAVLLVAVSGAVADWTAMTHGLPRDRFHVITNGSDTNLFRPPEERSHRSEPLRVICHGRIDPNKGFDIAANAVAMLRKQGVEVSLTLVGSVRTFGMPEEDVARYSSSLDAAVASADARRLSRQPLEEVAKVLRDSDVAVVVPVSEEPCPLTLLESMASGCAIVASRSGGIPELLGGAGTLVDKHSVDQVADALRALATDDELLTNHQKLARHRAEELTWHAAAHRLRVVLGDVRDGD